MILRVRYALIVISLVASVILIVAGALLHQFRSSIHQVTETSADSVAPMLIEQLWERGEVLTRLLAENLTNPVYQFDMEAIYDLLAAAREQKDVLSVQVFDPLGNIVHDGNKTVPGYGLPLPDVNKTMLNAQHLISRNKADKILFYLPIHVGDKRIGGLKMVFSLKRIQVRINDMRDRIEAINVAERHRNLKAIIWLTLLLSGLGMIVAMLVARGLSRPIADLTRRAEALGQGDMKSTISLPRKDELGILAATLDEMRRNLQASYDRIHGQNEELKELDRMKDDFLANVTHELKTPLNGILGLGAAIRDGAYGTIPEAMRKPTGQIVVSAERLLKLTLQILTFSKDQQALTERRDVPLRAQIERCLESFELQA